MVEAGTAVVDMAAGIMVVGGIMAAGMEDGMEDGDGVPAPIGAGAGAIRITHIRIIRMLIRTIPGTTMDIPTTITMAIPTTGTIHMPRTITTMDRVTDAAFLPAVRG